MEKQILSLKEELKDLEGNYRAEVDALHASLPENWSFSSPAIGGYVGFKYTRKVVVSDKDGLERRIEAEGDTGMVKHYHPSTLSSYVLERYETDEDLAKYARVVKEPKLQFKEIPCQKQ